MDNIEEFGLSIQLFFRRMFHYANKNQLITDQELLVSNMLEIQAVIRILTRKGITTEDEIMEEIKNAKRNGSEKVGGRELNLLK